MKSEDVLVIVAVLAVIVSFVGLGFTYSSVMSFKNLLTGFATDTGTINITIETSTAVNFTTDNINFSSGSLDANAVWANMSTEGNCSQDNCSVNPWSDDGPFTIENIGNINVTTNISFNKDAESLLGSNDAAFKFKVEENESGSCDAGTLSNTDYQDANSTEQAVCDNLGWEAGSDSLNIHINLRIPSDATTGELSAVASLNYQAIS